MEWFGYELAGVAWVGPVLGTFVFAWGGWPFLGGAVAEVRDRPAGDDAADRHGHHGGLGGVDGRVSLGWFDLEFWWELAALVTIMLLGHWQEMKAIGQAQGALAALAAAAARRSRSGRRGATVRTVPLATCASATWCWCGRAGGCPPTG